MQTASEIAWGDGDAEDQVLTSEETPPGMNSLSVTRRLSGMISGISLPARTRQSLRVDMPIVLRPLSRDGRTSRYNDIDIDSS